MKLKYLFFLNILILTHQARPYFTTALNNFFQHAPAAFLFIQGLSTALMSDGQAEKLQDAHPDIKKFCEKNNLLHNEKPLNFSVKIDPDTFFLEALGTKTILIDAETSSRLHSDIKQYPSESLIFWNFFVRHELEHLKNKDSAKSGWALVACTAFTYFLKKGMSFIFFKKSFQKKTIRLLSGRIAIGIAHFGFSNALWGAYNRHLEMRADKGALQSFNPKELSQIEKAVFDTYLKKTDELRILVALQTFHVASDFSKAKEKWETFKQKYPTAEPWVHSLLAWSHPSTHIRKEQLIHIKKEKMQSTSDSRNLEKNNENTY